MMILKIFQVDYIIIIIVKLFSSKYRFELFEL